MGGRRRFRPCSTAAVLGAAALVSGAAEAQEPRRDPEARSLATHEEPDEPLADKPGYTQLFASVMAGTGFRFNNPYRLPSPLGDDAESVSRTATYLDIGLAMTLGSPLGFQHGGALRITTAIEGVGQVVMTPSYFGYRRWGQLALFGRAGIPAVLSPDVTWGFEGALGGAFFFLGGVGAAFEMVGDVFYGTGTRDVATAAYPVLAAQLGLLGTYEVLP